MTTPFNFTSTIKNAQNTMIASTIKEVSNLELLKSEEAIKAVLKSYTDRFRAVEGMLTDVSKYVAKSETIIRLADFNKMFESIYIDLSALYNDLDIVDSVLSLNLNRNKNYFLVIKKRVKDLWQRLELTRLQVYDIAPADESFYESFYSAINSTFVSNIKIDKKNGFMVLDTKRKRLLNDVPYIKSVTATTYPVENEDGGVLFTTSPLNDINTNYTEGTRDLLSDGLWKEQVLCKDIPDMVINIGSDANPIRRNFRGVVSIVDIEYTYPVELNRVDIDVFGEKVLDIDCILYKANNDDQWTPVLYEGEDHMEEASPITDLKYKSVAGRAFDVISFLNLQKISVKHLRIVFNQQNYSLLDSETLPERTLEQQIELDLSERRYELVKFDASLEQELATPVNENNRSLYSKIISVIESTRNIELILEKINKILVPELKTISTTFSKTAMFEIGAWSIEPSIEEYTRLQGKYDSKPYVLKGKTLISAQLKSSQDVPNATTCNWYVTVNGSDIPIMENDLSWRKEPFNIVPHSNIESFSNWPGTFILLDFPVDPLRAEQIGIYENGIFNYQFTTRIAFLNSRLLYLHDLDDPLRSEFVVRYPLAKYNCVTTYVLNYRSSQQLTPVSLGIVSARRDVLERFSEKAKLLQERDSSGLPSEISANYTISSALATVEEAQLWFGSAYAACVFIDDSVKSLLDLSGLGSLSSIVTNSISKLATTLSDIELYYQGSGSGFSDLGSIGIFPNVVPLSFKRIV